MSSQSIFTVPDEVTFEQAIALTQTFLDEVAQGNLPEAVISQTTAALVSNQNGARGFFVTYLTGDSPLADQPSEAVLTGLRSQPELVADLLVKNLAMSTAMIMTHTCNQNPDLAIGSTRVQQRTDRLISLLHLIPVQIRLQQLLTAITTGSGADQAFLTRWGYDAEQQQSIQQALQRALT